MQVRQCVALGIKRVWLEQQAFLGGETRGRLGVHFELDLERALAAHLHVVDRGALFHEGGDHRRFHRFRVGSDGHLESEGSELTAHGVEVRRQGEGVVRGEQGEIEVFGEPGQAVEDAQAGAAVERGLVEEAATLQAGQGDFLHHFAQGVFAFLRGIAR